MRVLKESRILGLADAPRAVAAKRYSCDGAVEDVTDAVQKESFVEVVINGVSVLRICCSAESLIELVLGRLLTEGVISSIDDIASVDVDEEALRVALSIPALVGSETLPACKDVRTYGSAGASFGAGMMRCKVIRKIDPIEWDPDWIFCAARIFEQDKTAHAITKGAHSCYLFMRDHMLYCSEDIGRHNAFDKVIGHAMLDGIDLSQCIVFTSGRVPTDMAIKAVRAHIPLVASKAVATDRTIEMARAWGLTLICRATSASFEVLSGA